jgi:GR25 family glycosyltransferase involved in LPS biosynthesis
MKIFCIALKNNNQSIKMLNDCLESASLFGWNIEIFWGVNKDNITANTWKAVNLVPSLDSKFQRRIGAQGCFLSHYQLWQQCLELNEPLIILEHDAIINSTVPYIKTDYELVKLHQQVKKPQFDHYTGSWSVGSHAYYIAPSGALKLINWAKNNFGYHVDKMLGTNLIKYKYLDTDVVSLNKNNKSTIT